MNAEINPPTLVDDELDVLSELAPLGDQDIIELGCGAAQLARALLVRHPDARVTGVEVDERQHAKNIATPQAGLHCPRRPNFDHPCRLNNDQGWKAARSAAVCG
jgi:hypothetical protein